MVKRHALAAGVVVGLLAGCSENVTQYETSLFVVVEGDRDVRANGRVVEVTVARAGAQTAPGMPTQVFMRRPHEWPFSFVVRPVDARARVEITARVLGEMNTPPIAVARVITGYLPDQALVVPLVLWTGCTMDACSAQQTCREPVAAGAAAVCDNAEQSPDSLARYSASGNYGACAVPGLRVGADCRMPPRMLPDAGMPGDVGPDVPGIDAPGFDGPPPGDGPAVVDAPPTNDAAVDAGSDAGVDVPRDAGTADAPPDVGVDAGADVPGSPDSGTPSNDIPALSDITGGVFDRL